MERRGSGTVGGLRGHGSDSPWQGWSPAGCSDVWHTHDESHHPQKMSRITCLGERAAPCLDPKTGSCDV